jgi:beta-glucosidase-like glycosyl hydrolase
MAQRVDDIEAAFYRVKSSAEKVIGGDEASKDQSFQDIFALNNEIGRLAREQPATMHKMKELQAFVNMITVGIKYGRTADLLEGLAVAEESIKAMKNDVSSGP